MEIWVPSGFVCRFHGGLAFVCTYGHGNFRNFGWRPTWLYIKNWERVPWQFSLLSPCPCSPLLFLTSAICLTYIGERRRRGRKPQSWKSVVVPVVNQSQTQPHMPPPLPGPRTQPLPFPLWSYLFLFPLWSHWFLFLLQSCWFLLLLWSNWFLFLLWSLWFCYCLGLVGSCSRSGLVGFLFPLRFRRFLFPLWSCRFLLWILGFLFPLWSPQFLLRSHRFLLWIHWSLVQGACSNCLGFVPGAEGPRLVYPGPRYLLVFPVLFHTVWSPWCGLQNPGGHLLTCPSPRPASRMGSSYSHVGKGRCFGHIQSEGGPDADPRHAGVKISLSWPGKASSLSIGRWSIWGKPNQISGEHENST